MENNATDMTITPAFTDALQGMADFFYEMNPDIDMCYDWVCEMAQVSTFVHNNDAWDMFYDAWESLQDDA